MSWVRTWSQKDSSAVFRTADTASKLVCSFSVSNHSSVDRQRLCSYCQHRQSERLRLLEVDSPAPVRVCSCCSYSWQNAAQATGKHIPSLQHQNSHRVSEAVQILRKDYEVEADAGMARAGRGVAVDQPMVCYVQA